MATEGRTIETAGLRLLCPSGWAGAEGVEGAAILLVRADPGVADSGFATNVNVRLAPGGVAVDDEQGREALLLAAFDQLGASLPDPLLLDFERCEIAGRPAGRLVATYVHGGRGLTLDQWLLPRDEDQVVISGTARNVDYPEVIAAFEAVAASLEEVGE